MRVAKGDGDERAVKVHQRDLDTLGAVAKAMHEKMHFHAYVGFHSLDEVMRDSMPLTEHFLSGFSDPSQDSKAEMPYE